jgi:hypothetical protein
MEYRLIVVDESKPDMADTLTQVVILVVKGLGVTVQESFAGTHWTIVAVLITNSDKPHALSVIAVPQVAVRLAPLRGILVLAINGEHRSRNTND